MAKNFQKSVLGLALGNMFLMVSLKAKLKACVGKYRMTLARFPRQKESTPCSADTRVKQFPIPAEAARLHQRLWEGYAVSLWTRQEVHVHPHSMPYRLSMTGLLKSACIENPVHNSDSMCGYWA